MRLVGHVVVLWWEIVLKICPIRGSAILHSVVRLGQAQANAFRNSTFYGDNGGNNSRYEASKFPGRHVYDASSILKIQTSMTRSLARSAWAFPVSTTDRGLKGELFDDEQNLSGGLVSYNSLWCL